MKKCVAFFTFLFALSSVQTGSAATELSNDDIRAGKLFPFESAKIVYKKSGMSEGTETLWISDYGKKQVRQTKVTTKSFGFTNTDESISIVTPEKVTTINLKEKTGIRMDNPMKDFYAGLKNKSDAEIEELKKSGMIMARQMTGQQEIKPIGKEKILGKEAEIYVITAMGITSKSWIWNNLTLKTEASVMGNDSIDEAVSIEIGAAAPSEKSLIPEGVQIQEMPAMGQQNPFANLGQPR